MKEVDLVPEESRSPGQYQRTALVKLHQTLIETVVAGSVRDGFTLDNTVVVLMDDDAKQLLQPEVPSLSRTDRYVMVGPREGFREFLEAKFADPELEPLYTRLDAGAPPHHVWVLIAAFNGLTLAAMGPFVAQNAPTPNSPGN